MTRFRPEAAATGTIGSFSPIFGLETVADTTAEPQSHNNPLLGKTHQGAETHRMT